MTHSTIAVIGGGLAGLNAARLIHAASVDVQLYGARDRLGGRILSLGADGTQADTTFDLGPSWFWPDMQPAIAQLVLELGLESSAQELPVERQHLGKPVLALEAAEGRVRLCLPERIVTADQVIAALPPRLLQARLRFNPALPPQTERLWREAGCLGTAQSVVGPMPEIHDATTARGSAALFGFWGWRGRARGLVRWR